MVKVRRRTETGDALVWQGATVHLTERFTRVGDDTLRYEFTVVDPDTLTQPITGILQLQQGASPLFEYACHEGHYGMRNALSGARMAEKVDNRD